MAGLIETVAKGLDAAVVASNGGMLVAEEKANMWQFLKDTLPTHMCADGHRIYDKTVSRESWEADVRIGEDEWLAAHYDRTPETVHDKGARAGQWKYRTLLKGTGWPEAKSILGTAIDLGIDPVDMGKTAVQNAIKQVKEAHELGVMNGDDTSNTPFGKYQLALNRFAKAYRAFVDACPDEEGDARDAIRSKFDLD